MRRSLCALLVMTLLVAAPWRGAAADDGPGAHAVPAFAAVERFGQFSYQPAPYADADMAACPECVDLTADAGGGGASATSGWLVLALIVVVVLVASSSDSGDGSGY